MLTVEQIEKYLEEINSILNKTNSEGEIILAGGAVMALVYGARNSTKDIDALFKPSDKFRNIINSVARKYNLNSDWLNDGVKGFFTDKMHTNVYKKYSNLIVYTLDAESMLALKLTSARFDSHDQDDSIYLMNVLKINSLEDLFAIVDKLIPMNRLTINCHYFILDTFEKYKGKYGK